MYKAHLKYAEKVDGDWEIQIIEENADLIFTPSHDFLPNGNPAICYTLTPVNEDIIKFAQLVGTAWEIETIETKQLCITARDALAISPGGDPVVCFWDWPWGQVGLATRDGGGWDIEYAVAIRGAPSFAYGPLGSPGVATDFQPGVRYYGFDGESWNMTQVTSESLSLGELAFDSNNIPAISFIQYEEFPNGEIVVAWLR